MVWTTFVSPNELLQQPDTPKLRTDQLVRFQAHSSTRKSVRRAGDIVSWSEGTNFARCPRPRASSGRLNYPARKRAGCCPSV
jgi:hypothetical protein